MKASLQSQIAAAELAARHAAAIAKADGRRSATPLIHEHLSAVVKTLRAFEGMEHEVRAVLAGRPQ